MSPRPGWMLAALIALSILGPLGIVMMFTMPEVVMQHDGNIWYPALGVGFTPIPTLIGLGLGWVGYIRRIRWMAILGIVVAAVPVVVGYGQLVWTIANIRG